MLRSRAPLLRGMGQSTWETICSLVGRGELFALPSRRSGTVEVSTWTCAYTLPSSSGLRPWVPDLVEQVQVYPHFLIRLLDHEVLESRWTFLDLDGDQSIRSIYQAERCLLGGGFGSGVVSPHNPRDRVCPSSLGFLQSSP